MRFVLLLGLFWLLLDASPGNAAVSNGEFRLSRVKFIGVENVSEKALAKTLVARTPSSWRFWAKRPVVTEEDLKDDLLRIRQFYEASGYYRTECSYEITREGPKDGTKEGQGQDGEKGIPRITVTFTVQEGPPVIVEDIVLAVEDAERMPPPTFSWKDLYAQLQLERGDIFVEAKYRETKRELDKYLGNTGYPSAQVEGEVKVFVAQNRARISLSLKPGLRCRFGELSISGNEGYVNPAVVRQAMAFQTGELYSDRKLVISQRNLFNLGIFAVARVTSQAINPDAKTVPVLVQVRPRERQRLRLGIGYGTEDGIRLQSGWTYRNVSGWADRVSIRAKRSDLVRSFGGEYFLPYFLHPKNTFQSTAGIEEDLLESYENRKTFAEALVTRLLSDKWTLAGGYFMEANELEDVDVSASQLRAAGVTEENYFISAVESEIVRNTTNTEIDPTKGSVSSFHFEVASGILGSEVSYFKPTLRLIKYYPLFRGVVLGGRLRLRAIQETEDTHDIPIFKRLFLGGSNSVRGYGFQKLGPVDEGGTPIGGLSAMDANLEIRYPVFRKLSGVVFLDMGLVDETAFTYKLNRLRYSCGVGLRYMTVVGPIRLDFGYKLNPPTIRDFGKPTFPDEEIEDRWKIHLSVGQAF